MSSNLSRRAALGGLGLGVAAAVAAAAPASAEGADDQTRGTGPAHLRRVYQRQKTKAGGVWHSHVALRGADGTLETVVADDPDAVVDAYSVQKLAVAVAVLDKVDRGLLQLGQKLDLPADLILGGSGIYHLQTVWGDDLTIANFLTAMLLVSDNTSVRMCGRVAPALEINEILAAKGFVDTRVIPVANPNRFYLGKTTPAEVHDLLWRLANKTLLSAKSCDFLLGVTRWVNGYHDGVRRNMSSNERSRVAIKYGADFNTLGAGRHEVGIMFDSAGAPAATFAFFADSLGGLDNYGATHPAVEAHAVLGRQLFDSLPAPVAGLAARSAQPAIDLTPFREVNGG
ncbi:class A beta-lactamase-related serine hydrolase [Catellatospora sp. KI3]|uniref:serine hydrolase n=1 Tax=Catellatospora sp. KI3 TaxID=3041620 RepID=UPI0024825B77|nr:serine hydrolase [Catellatospora sp. KI3]MDI1461542.1 class A beta-lactamase-related serine hydrolase [Catellatospora sp. KI3]